MYLDLLATVLYWVLRAKTSTFAAGDGWARGGGGARASRSILTGLTPILPHRATIARVAALANVECPGVESEDAFILKEGMTKFGETDERKGAMKKYSNAQRFYSTAAYMKVYTQSAHEVVWQSLDREFEQEVLGYSYDHLKPPG